MLLVSGLRNEPQKFQPSAVNRKYRSDQADNCYFFLRAESGVTLNTCISAANKDFEK